MDRGYYERQISLPEIGQMGQARLVGASVMVVGAGGLGSPLLFALAGAGVGCIGIVDFDRVSASNLNRQFLYTPEDIGQPKAEMARQRLSAYHPDLVFEAFDECLDLERALILFENYDLVIAAVDRVATRRVINAACCRLGKPWIDGGIRGFTGYAAIVIPGRTPCYDCLFGFAGEPLTDAALAACATPTPPGVLGATAGAIGSLQAALAVQLLLGLPDPLHGDVFYLDAKRLSADRVHVERTPECPICGALWPAEA